MKKQNLLTKLLLLCAMIVGGVNGVWADTVIKTIDFSEAQWSDVTFSQTSKTDPEVKNGVTFNSKHDTRTFSIKDGVLTFPDNNVNSGNYVMGFPVTGVLGGRIVIKVYNGNSETQVKYTVKDGGTNFSNSDCGSGTTATKGTPCSIEKTGLTNDNVYVYIGRSSASYTTITKIEVITYETVDLTASSFYSFYQKSNSNVPVPTLISDASLPSYINMDVSMNDNSTSNTTFVETPHDFTKIDDSKYWRLKPSKTSKIVIGGLSNVKSIRLYGNGSGYAGNITTTVTKISGAGSALTVGDVAFENSQTTIKEYSTGDLTKLLGYDADTYYLYTISITGEGYTGYFSLWGIYIECLPNSFTVTYDANGGTGTVTDSNSPYISGSTVTVLGNGFSYAGHSFTGWNTADDGSGTPYDAGDTFSISGNTTLYAQWEESDAPSIVTQPTGGVFAKDASVTLSVEASPSTGEECGYQWYSCDDAEKTNAVAVEDETSASFSPSSATAGNYYYFCRVSDGGSNTTDTEVVRVRISPRAAVSTWDITTLQEGDVKYNTEFWTNSGTYTYTHGGITSGTTITAQNNFGTDLLNGITLGRNGGEGTITLFVDNTNGRYAIGVMGNTSKPGVIKVPVESGHYYRVTYCSCNDGQTLGFAVSGADATGTTATLSTRYTSTASFVAKATSTEMTLTNDGTGANYVMLVKIEEVEALDGAWSVASDAVYRGDAAPSTPTFAVTPSNGGSATLGTEYSVSYALKDGSTDGIVTVNSSTGITAISTATVGTATVTATVTDLIDDDEFIVETATYEYSITVNTPVAPTISATTGANTVPQDYSVTLTATANGAPAPTIQWYSNTTASNEGGIAIDGATNTSYAPSTSVLGTYYYYAVATNSAGSATSSLITLKVAEYAPIFSANASAALNVDPSTDLAPYTEITSTNATITGGSMYAHNGQTSAKTLVVAGNSGSFAFTNNNTNFKVVLSKALQAGDIISSKVGNSKDFGIKIYTTEALGGYAQADETYDAIILNTTGSFGLEKPYIIKPSDTNLIGATTLYIYRATGNGTYFDELTISREVLTPGTITFDPEDGETLSPDTEISLASNRATSIKWQWGSVAVDDPEDDSWSSAQTYADNNKPAAGAIGSTDNVLSVLATNAHGSVVSSASYTFRGASDLAFVNGGMLAVKGAESISYTFAADKDYTTSSDGAITLTSSNTNVATVDGTDGMKINFVDGAVGITTITLTQAETSSYAGGSLVFTVAATGTHVVPSTTLDLSNATTSKTTLTGTWNSTGDKPYYGNDGTDNYLVFSSYSAYASNTNQTWINQPKSGTQLPTSLNAVWSPTGVFLGSKGYPVSVANFGTNDGKAKFASINAQSSADDVSNRRARTWHAYQVKGISKAQILANATSASYNIMLAVYEVDGSVAASTTHMNYISGNSDQVLTVGGLDVNKTYLVTISTDRTQNVYFYETAFFFSTDLGITETITPAYNKTTYVTRSSMDFTGTGLRAYVATDHDGNNTGVTMTRVEQVPAGTPVLLAGTASTAYTIPVGSYADAPATNYLKGGDNSTTFDGTTPDFLLYSDGIFYLIGSGKIAVNKAYLHLEDTKARSLSINFDDEEETTGIKDLLGKKAEINGDVYDLSGRKVAQPRKGLYIVNGRKVVIK